jgi:hypothetical protein
MSDLVGCAGWRLAVLAACGAWADEQHRLQVLAWYTPGTAGTLTAANQRRVTLTRACSVAHVTSDVQAHGPLPA